MALAFLQRSIDKHFDKFSGIEKAARQLTLGAEWRNEGNNHDQSRIDHELRDLRHSANVFHTVGLGEAQIPIEAVANIVTVQDIGVLAFCMETFLQQIGDGRLA
jgi:hypothetical protein